MRKRGCGVVTNSEEVAFVMPLVPTMVIPTNHYSNMERRAD